MNNYVMKIRYRAANRDMSEVITVASESESQAYCSAMHHIMDSKKNIRNNLRLDILETKGAVCTKRALNHG